MLKHYTKKLGLSENESSVYLTLLEQGEFNAKSLAERAGINRTTVIYTLTKLLDAGLVGINIRGKRKFYFAKNPQKILDMVLEKKNFLEAVMPQLIQSFDKQRDGNRIQVYDTISGLKQAFEDVNRLNPKKNELLTIEGDVASQIKLGFNFWQKLLSQKKFLNINSRTILPEREKDNFIFRDHPIDIRLTGLLNNFRIICYLYSNKTVLILPKETLCIIIENQSIKNALTDIFEIVWKKSKPFPSA